MSKLSFAIISLVARFSFAQEACPTTWRCHQVKETAPAIDADLSDWADIEGISTSLASITSESYMQGELSTFKCQYDQDRIYLSLEIPGEYKFNLEDNHHCASIATMTKIGTDATFYNMGGCPDCAGGNFTDTCDPYRVDIGAHWELRTTDQGVPYNVQDSSITQAAASLTGTGDDPLANNDDEYAVNAFCRADDDDANASNEWGGAWKHTNPIEGELGTYVFELVRDLKTASMLTDAQYTAGETISFGVAFWDPYETEAGWTDAGHFVTGCTNQWIDLELVTGEVSPQDEGTSSGDVASAVLGFVAGALSMMF